MSTIPPHAETYQANPNNLGAELDRLSSLLASPDMDPDPERHDWRHHPSVEEVWRLSTTAVPQAFDALIVELHDPEIAHRVRYAAADGLGDAAALLYAAGRLHESREVLAQAHRIGGDTECGPLLTAAHTDTSAYTHAIRAVWLLQHNRRAQAIALAKTLATHQNPAISNLAREIIEAPRPLTSAPSLFTLNGFGVRVYGERDHHQDGSYITTRYLTALFVPVLPLDAFRVQRDHESGGWSFMSKNKLTPFARVWKLSGLVALALLVGWGSISSYLDSPERRLGLAIDAIEEAEEEGASQDELLAQYEAVLRDFPEGDPESLQPVIEALIALNVASVPSPLTEAELAEVERVAMAFLALPDVARQPFGEGLMVAAFETWADELGADTQEAKLAQLDILAHAEGIAQGTGASRVRDRIRDTRRGLAEELAEDWPIEAVRQYASIDDAESYAAAAKIFADLGPGPSVWIELEPEVRWWLDATGSDTGLEDARQSVADRFNAAKELTLLSERTELLETRELEALVEALEKVPGDQEIAVALADSKWTQGDLDGAIGTLESLGGPGRMVFDAQSLQARLFAAAGREAEAAQLLQRVVSSRMPAFRTARRSYASKAGRIEEDLLARAQRGDIPEPYASRFDRANEAEVSAIFSEWLDETIGNNAGLAILRDRYAALSSVVPLAIQLGTLQLQRGNATDGEEREALLAAAERAFLAIASEGRGLPSYHVGLGEVYYRLGKTEEAESEFGELLASGDPRSELAVASSYRGLGMTDEARKVAESVFERAESPLKEEAAQLRSLLSIGRQDQVTWLRKSNQESHFVKLSLLEAEGFAFLDEGLLEEAGEKFTQASQGWANGPVEDGAAANNAAVAMQSSYVCTGERKHLRAARKSFQRSVSLQPEAALVVGNLAESIEYVAVLGVLDAWINPDRLHLGQSDARTLLDAIVDGPDAPAIRTALRENRGLREALDTYQRHNALAPSAGSDRSLADWQLLTATDEELVEGAAGLGDQLPEEAEEEEDEDDLGRYDDVARAHYNAMLARYGAIAAESRKLDPASRAALQYLEATIHWRMAQLDWDADRASRAAEALAEATGSSPKLGGHSSVADAWMTAAILRAAKSEPRVQSLVEEHWRDGFQRVALAVLDDEAALAAVRSQSELGKAAAAARSKPDKGWGSWIISRLASDAELEQAARTHLATPVGEARHKILAWRYPGGSAALAWTALHE